METFATKPLDRLREKDAKSLLRDLEDAALSLQGCLRELENVLNRPTLDAGSLTSVRLKLASLRLTRGPLIARVSDLLSANVTEGEGAILEQLRASHHRLLQVATAHTARWTLDAIAGDWAGYRRQTRELLRQWAVKAESEQRLLYPLVQKCAASGQPS